MTWEVGEWIVCHWAGSLEFLLLLAVSALPQALLPLQTGADRRGRGQAIGVEQQPGSSILASGLAFTCKLLNVLLLSGGDLLLETFPSKEHLSPSPSSNASSTAYRDFLSCIFALFLYASLTVLLWGSMRDDVWISLISIWPMGTCLVDGAQVVSPSQEPSDGQKGLLGRGVIS